MNPTLKQKIIQDLGLDNLPENQQEEVILNIAKIIFQAVLIRIIENLNKEEKDEFEKSLIEKSDDEQAMLDFLQLKIPNLNEIINEEIIKLKKEITNFIKK